MEHQSILRGSSLRMIRDSIADSPVTALLGPRQCGKTTLVRGLASRPENYFDLHNLVDSARLEDSNFAVLDGLNGTVVIDEAQMKPELFPKLRVLADRPEMDTRFLLTGSASPRITRGVSESLAGRVRFLDLGGFNPEEVGWEGWQALWHKGGFPPSYLKQLPANSFQWRLDYISTFLGRDLPLLSDTQMSQEQLRRLLQLIAHNHGQHWNHSEAAKIVGVNYKTIQRHIEILKGAFILRELPPFHVNIRKRLRKAPKIYYRDSGLLHALLLVKHPEQLSSHPKYGASWEGFAIEQIVRLSNSREEECFSFSIQGGPEVDLLLQKPSGRFGFEFKVGDAPRKSASMVTACQDLNLQKLFVIYPGQLDYTVDDRIEVVGFTNLRTIIPLLQ